jgi:MFS family permease
MDRAARKKLAMQKTRDSDTPRPATEVLDFEVDTTTSSDPTTTIDPTNFNLSKYRIASVLIAAILYGTVTNIRSSLFFWYCRTLIRCPTSNSTFNITNNSTLYSGSPICEDHLVVADGAQVLSTISSTFSTLMALIFVPVLGALSDRCGRKPILILGSLNTVRFVL